MIKILATIIFIFNSLYTQESTQFQVNQNEVFLKNYDSNKEFYNEILNYYDTIAEKPKGYKQFMREYEFYGQRKMSDSDFNLRDAFRDHLKSQSTYKKSPEFQAAGDWKFLGPATPPVEFNGARTTLGLGRINMVKVDPNNDNIIYVGSASGGIWKTTDAGNNWNVLPNTDFASIGISDIAIAKTNSNIIYAATGDINSRNGIFEIKDYSIGLIKSTDGGQSWSLTNLFAGISKGDQLNLRTVLVNPTNENEVFVTSISGFWKSSNGGDTWTQVDAGNYGDAVMNPADPDFIHTVEYSGNSAVFKTYSDKTGAFVSTKTYSSCTRVEFAVTASQPNYVYALSTTGSAFRTVDRSTDNGASWQERSSINGGVNYLGYQTGTGQDLNRGQAWYDLCIAVNPENAQEVFIGGVNLWKSTNGGTNFQLNTIWYQVGNSFVHADQHALEWNKANRLYSGCDGGIFLTTNNGSTWNDLSKGIGITQFYGFGSSMQRANVYIAGAQDNGTMVFDGTAWRLGAGGDGMQALVDPNNDKIMYGSNGSAGGAVFKFTNGGSGVSAIFDNSISKESSHWVFPLEIDPSNSNILYVGHANVWKSTNGGGNWTKTSNFSTSRQVRKIAVSAVNSNYLWASTSNQGSSTSILYFSDDAGANWTQVFTNGRHITDIEPSTSDVNICYITLLGYGAGQKVYEINGTQSTNISGNLPNLSANAIIEDSRTGDLYVGMDAGIYVLKDGKSTWNTYSKNLPSVAISELEIQKSSHKLRACTYGRGIWEVDLIDCDITAPDIIAKSEIEFCEGDSVQLTFNGTFPSFKWSNGLSQRTITVKNEGEYYLEVTDSKGCSALSNIINVSTLPKPAINITLSGETTICKGDSLRISLTGFFKSYTWSTGETTKAIQVTESGDYYVDVVGNNDCSARSEIIKVTVKNAPNTPVISREGNSLVSTDSPNYQWYKDGKILNGAKSKTYEPKENGIYTMEVLSGNGCDKISEEFVVDWFLNVEKAKELGFLVQPNPNSGVFSLIYPNATGDYKLEISNEEGALVYTEMLMISNGLNKELRLDYLIKGAYFVSLIKNNTILTQKIIVK